MSKKTFRGFIALLIVLVLGAIAIACGIGSQDVNGKWFQNSNVLTWFDNWGKGQEKPDDDSSKDNISLASYALEAADFAAYGISPQALEAKVITVDFEPANTTNKRIGWVCKWKNASSEWASGKNINDYVDFVPAADFGASATLAVKQPFGEPVVVTATSRANSALTSSSQFEYVARYTATNDDSDYDGIDITDGIDFLDGLYMDENVYTVLPDNFFITATMTFREGVYSYIYDRGGEGYDFPKEFTFEGSFLSWDVIHNEFSNFDVRDLAAWCIENDDREVFSISIRFECYYNNEVIYTFTDSGNCVYLTQDCINSFAVPPTNITVNPSGGAF